MVGPLPGVVGLGWLLGSCPKAQAAARTKTERKVVLSFIEPLHEGSVLIQDLSLGVWLARGYPVETLVTLRSSGTAFLRGVRRFFSVVHSKASTRSTGYARLGSSYDAEAFDNCDGVSKTLVVKLTRSRGRKWWARKDLNLGPMDYESTALTAELQARPWMQEQILFLQRYADNPSLVASARSPWRTMSETESTPSFRCSDAIIFRSSSLKRNPMVSACRGLTMGDFLGATMRYIMRCRALQVNTPKQLFFQPCFFNQLGRSCTVWEGFFSKASTASRLASRLRWE